MMRRLRLLALLAGSSWSAAGACPNCAGQDRASSELVWLACLIAVPVVSGLATGIAVVLTLRGSRSGVR